MDQPFDSSCQHRSVGVKFPRLTIHQGANRFLTEKTTLLASADGPVGKRLDFLSQEILRELNTVGSKARDLELTREVLEMKSETEKIREQVQNVE